MATVLILEDEPGLRNLFALVLRQDGHKVLEAADAEQAERVSIGQGIDALIANMVLPGGKGGTDFAIGLMQSQPNVRVLFVSGWPVRRDSDVENIAKLQEGSYAFLQKPFGNNELVAQVRTLLNTVKRRTA